MADISMRMKSWSNLDKTATEVIFENQEEPIDADALVGLFVRFATACGYAEESIAESLIGLGMELLPRRKDDGA